MAPLVELLGETLASKVGTVSTAEALSGKEVVALFFEYSRPSNRTERLAGWYEEGLKAKGLEVVFVSPGNSLQDDFDEAMKVMPWLALPFGHDKKQAILNAFGLDDSAEILLLDADGNPIHEKGWEIIAGDSEGEYFPWKPKTARDILGAAKILGPGGVAANLDEVLAGKSAVGLYFGASFSDASREYAKVLAQWYKQDLQGKGLEVIYISWDKTEEAFNSLFADMPWHALDYADQASMRLFGRWYGVDEIPKLLIFTPDLLDLINFDGAQAVEKDPQGNKFPWKQEPVREFFDCMDSAMRRPALVAFCDRSGSDQTSAVLQALEPVAKKHLELQKSLKPAAGFFIVRTSNEDIDQFRTGVKLPPSGDEPKLVLIDIPGGEWFVQFPEDQAISTETVEAFVNDYLAGKFIAERRKLG